MIKAVLFDLDGTLLNREESVKLFIDNQYERFQYYLKHIPKDTYISRFLHLDNHGYVWKDIVYEQLVRDFFISELCSEDLLHDYISNFHLFAVPFENLFSMLEELKNQDILLGIITNGFGQFQMDNINALGITPYFHTILVSEWEGIKKPDPVIFQRALKTLNISPSDCMYVGDHFVNDIHAAQKVGMKAIWKRNADCEGTTAEFVIDDLFEISTIVKSFCECR